MRRSNTQSAVVKTGVAYHPRGVMLWLQVFIVVFFFGFGLFVIFAGLGSSAAAVCVLIALFLFALGLFFLLNLIGFRSQHLTLRDDGISFCLAPLGNNLVMPWKLQSEDLPWSSVRALDVKLRNLGSPQRVYVLRTTAGDVTFSWPQWPNAEAIAQEIIRRSGASTSTEDMDLPPVPDPNQPRAPAQSSAGERFMRGFGTVMLIISAILALLCVIALFGAKPEDRWSIAIAFLFLGIAAATAQGLRRYRRIR